MFETKPTLEHVAESARLALARGDRDAARHSLSAALYSAETAASLSSETSESLFRLGTVYQDAGLLAEAERLFSDAIAVAERTTGPGNALLGPALVRLGTLMAGRGADLDAESVFGKALTIIERQPGDDGSELNDVLNALSRVLLRRGAFDRAAPLLEQLLVLKRAKGEDHPEVATVLGSLVLVRQAAGDHEGAEQIARRALQIRERTLAPNHYGIASALEQLAETCAARGKVAEAIMLHTRALSIREQTLGVGHSSLRTSRDRISDLRLQAADELGPTQFITSAYASAQSVAPRPTTPVPRAVAIPLEAAATLSTALTVAAETAASRMPAYSEHPPVDLDQRADGTSESLALPVFGDVLSLPDDAADRLAAGRFELRGAALSRLLSDRRLQSAVAVAGLATMFVAVRIAQSRSADEGRADGSNGRAGAIAGSTGSGASALQRLPGTGDSSLVHSANGSIAARSAERAPAPRSASHQNASELRPRRAADDASSLEIARAMRAPLPNVNVPASDSISRIVQPPVGADGFSKQFWTSALDRKTDADVGSPRNAKLIGDMPQPYYPEFLRKNGVEGEVVVQFTVDQNGRPDASTFEAVRSPHDALTNSVRKVVERMRFEPALTGGAKPVPRTEVVQISFVFKPVAK